MTEPRVPGGRGEAIDLPCGESIAVTDLDLGMRQLSCDCGDDHAVVTDVHPPSRFVPEELVEVLRGAVETDDEFDQFGTPHLMGAVMEEFPEEIVAEDCSEDGEVGYSLVWITDFDARRLHEVVVELVVELMEHAIGHADSDEATTEFERKMMEFDVEAFVDQYRKQRDFESEYDDPA